MNKFYSFLFVFSLSFFFLTPLLAQESEVVDVLVLRDGDIIKGTILELKENDYVIFKIEKTGKSEFFKNGIYCSN